MGKILHQHSLCFEVQVVAAKAAVSKGAVAVAVRMEVG